MTSGSPLEAAPAAATVVVGAGVVGTACALQLVRRGHDVILLDAEAPGSGCSSGNAGSISCQSVVPIALPGMLGQVPGWLTDPEGPLHVRWRYLPRAFPWLVRWLAASRMSVVRRSSEALKTLLATALEDYAELLGEQAYRRLVRARGQLLVWESSAPSRSEQVGHQLRERLDVEMQWLTPQEIADLEPALAPIFARGLLLKRHGHVVDPLGMVQEMAAQFRERGGRIQRGKVVGIRPAEGSGVTLALEGGAEMAARQIVVAAGAWSHRLARQVGIAVPLETERGYHVHLEGAADMCGRPVMHADRAFIATQMHDGLRLAGTVEIAGVDAPPRLDRAEVLHRQARRMFPSLGEVATRKWMGCRPSLPDSIPVIDRCPSSNAIIFAFGHGHLGVTGAARTARLVAEMVSGESPSIDLTPYRITRF